LGKTQKQIPSERHVRDDAFAAIEGLSAMDINRIPIGTNPPYDVNVIIEIPSAAIR